MLRADGLNIDRAMVLVVDFQSALLPSIRGHQLVVDAARKLLAGVGVFSMPVLATEQYPAGLGATVEPIAKCMKMCDARVYEKLTFSCCGEDAVRDALREIDRPQVIVSGIESHVCVQQTVLDLLAMDYQVFVCADAVGSRGRMDFERSLRRMEQAGAFVTTVESVLFELCERCGSERFKGLLKVIKSFGPPPRD